MQILGIPLGDLLLTLAFGLLVGWLASLIVGGGGLLKYLIWGLLGSVIGTFLFAFLGLAIDLGNAIVNRVVVSVIGAVVLVLVARMIG